MTECKHNDWVSLHMNKWCRRCGAIMRYQPGLNSAWEMPAPMSTGQQELANLAAFVEMPEPKPRTIRIPVSRCCGAQVEHMSDGWLCYKCNDTGPIDWVTVQAQAGEREG